jgi:hypothetical protein
MSLKHPLLIEQGATFELPLQLFTDRTESTPRDLTGYTARLQIRKTPDAVEPIFTASGFDSRVIAWYNFSGPGQPLTAGLTPKAADDLEGFLRDGYGNPGSPDPYSLDQLLALGVEKFLMGWWAGQIDHGYIAGPKDPTFDPAGANNFQSLNFCSFWDQGHYGQAPIPLACTDAVGYAGAGDWSLDAIAAFMSADSSTVEEAVVKYVNEVVGIPFNYTGYFWVDFEGASPVLSAYASVITALRAAFPTAKLGPWVANTPGGQEPGLVAACEYIFIECYQQAIETDEQAWTDATNKLNTWLATGKKIVPTLNLGIGWLHPSYPTSDPDAHEPLVAPNNLAARRAAIIAKMATTALLPAIVIWQGARAGDTTRAANLTALAQKIQLQSVGCTPITEPQNRTLLGNGYMNQWSVSMGVNTTRRKKIKSLYFYQGCVPQEDAQQVTSPTPDESLIDSTPLNYYDKYMTTINACGGKVIWDAMPPLLYQTDLPHTKMILRLQEQSAEYGMEPAPYRSDSAEFWLKGVSLVTSLTAYYQWMLNNAAYVYMPHELRALDIQHIRIITGSTGIASPENRLALAKDAISNGDLVAIDFGGFSAEMTQDLLNFERSVIESNNIALIGSEGKITVTIPAEVTATFTAPFHGYYDLELVSPTGRVERLIEGKVDITPEVTKS